MGSVWGVTPPNRQKPAFPIPPPMSYLHFMLIAFMKQREMLHP